MTRSVRSTSAIAAGLSCLLTAPLGSRAGAGWIRAAAADDAPACRVVEVALTPAADLQLVGWIEDSTGAYVDTVFITNKTGQYGLGNRPGIMEFNSGPRWPYGARTTTLPVWAHAHGEEFPLVHFQNGNGLDEGNALDNDRNLSHPFTQSSQETIYFRPLRPDEPGWDTGTTASFAYTDKGEVHATLTSKYPPRADVIRMPGLDSPSVDMFEAMNPFDEVSLATPAAGAPFQVSWAIPPDLAAGNYTLVVEAAKEFDHNATYSEAAYPPPSNLSWSEYGKPYRGQPSVVYRVPFVLGTEATRASTATYAGYGDPDGADGTVRPPDATIDTTVPGSGAARLQLVPDDAGGDLYRVRVVARPEFDAMAPGAATDPVVARIDHRSVDLVFTAPGEDGATGRVTGYEVRYRAGSPITADNFAASSPIASTIDPEQPGQAQSLTIDGLLPQTDYYVGIQAYDDCRNVGALVVIPFTTTERRIGEVDACFVATAAYGSSLAGDVEMLRHVRDAVLRQTVVGELAVAAYYTFGPALAGVVGESELLRASARAALAPVVGKIRRWAVVE